MVEGGVGIVETQYFRFAEAPHEFKLECGKKIAPVQLAYETYGKLNADKSNAILVMHAFSGDAHAAGLHPDDSKAGWWDFMIGPGRPLDTEKYYVLCANVIGGCKGSTGPSSINPKIGKPFGLDFPFITIGDMVRAQKELIDHLGIKKLLSVIGGSMGGMQVLQWVALYPDSARSAIPISATLKHTPQQIAFDEVGRQAVMADPHWNHGNYYGAKETPEKGLAVARMIGHITYMSDSSMEEKFSRRLKDNNFSFKFSADFEVESYLLYRGENFVKRFDANSYLYITKAMDYFDLSGGKMFESGKPIETRFLVTACKSDWLYPPYQSQAMVRELRMHHVDVSYYEVDSNYGHDAFLVEGTRQGELIKNFLKNL